MTLYGEINEQDLFVSLQKNEDKEIVLDEQERVQMEQAKANVIEEKAHIESYNRFKDLQTQYSKAFTYISQQSEVYIKCLQCYLPMEATIDRDSFEQLLVKTKPKHLVLINGSGDTKYEQIRRFCENNRIEINVKRADKFCGSLKFATNAGVK